MKKRKSKALQIIECIGLYAAAAAVRALPLKVLHSICRVLGGMLYAIMRRRREIALNNLKMAFGRQMTDKEIRRIARRSCQSFILTGAEMMRSPFRFEGTWTLRDKRYKTQHLEEHFQKAKKIHDEAGAASS